MPSTVGPNTAKLVHPIAARAPSTTWLEGSAFLSAAATAAASSSAPARPTTKGRIAQAPPIPAALTTVRWNDLSRSAGNHDPVSASLATSGLVIVATAMTTDETTVSAIAGPGRLRKASTSGTARNGSAVSRNRGPGENPPNGCQ